MTISVGVKITQDDFQSILDKTSLIDDLKPGENCLMQNLQEKGGVLLVPKYLLSKKMLHGDCITITGKALSGSLKDIVDIDFETKKIIQPIEKPIKEAGHIPILCGDLATKGSVGKITRQQNKVFYKRIKPL
jgi:dihydroxy-acid dehydratase